MGFWHHVTENYFLLLFSLRSILCVLERYSCLTSLDFSKLPIDKAAIISLWVHNSRLCCCWPPDTSQPIARHFNTHSDWLRMSLVNGACRSDCSQTQRVLKTSTANQGNVFHKKVFILINSLSHFHWIKIKYFICQGVGVWVRQYQRKKTCRVTTNRKVWIIK